MNIQRTWGGTASPLNSRKPDPKPPAAPTPAADEPARPEKKRHTPLQTARYAAFKFLDRRIPNTFPEITPETVKTLSDKMKPGDVILTTDLSYPGWERMEYWTAHSDYTHSAMVGSDGNVYESAGGGTRKVPVGEFFEGRTKVSIVRMGLTEDQVKTSTDYLQKNLGKPYDSHFDTASDKKYYCSEYVGKALEHGKPDLHIPRRNFGKKEVIAVDAFRKTPGAEMVHDGKSDYWGNKIHYWPVAAATLAGVAAGCAMAHGVYVPLAAAGGGLAGLWGSIMVGNKIQTGHWSPSLEAIRESKGNSSEGPPAA